MNAEKLHLTPVEATVLRYALALKTNAQAPRFSLEQCDFATFEYGHVEELTFKGRAALAAHEAEHVTLRRADLAALIDHYWGDTQGTVACDYELVNRVDEALDNERWKELQRRT